MDLNSDLGEGYGHWALGDDAALLEVVTSANVACGFHAGDPATIDRTVRTATDRGVAIGAQVSYPDLVGFGRREIDVPPDDLTADVLYQIGALEAFARAAGSRVRYVKPHGALYNRIARDPVQAAAVVEAIRRYDPALPLLTLPGSAAMRAAEDAGIPAVAEGFADRAYTGEGRLVSRREPGAVLHDPEQVRHPGRGHGHRGPGGDGRRRRGRGRDPLAVRPRRHPGGGRPGQGGPVRPGRRRGGPRGVRVRLRPAGERALLVEVEDLETVHRLHAALRALDPPGVVELVPAYRTVLVVADPTRTGVLDELAAELPDLELPPAGELAGEPVEIPVSYDGEDLPEVARLTGLEAEEVVRRHTAPEYTVAFLGFSPGFPYLVGLDPALEVPRRDTPRTSIPAGSVGLAGGQTGIYPTASPGGWQLIGRTEVTLFDPDHDPPALLGPGSRLRFTVAG